MASKLAFKNSPWEQGRNEIRPYKFDYTKLGETAENVVTTLYDLTEADENDPDTWLDVSADKLTGSDLVDGIYVVTKSVSDLEPNHTYRLEVLFEIDGRTEEYHGIINGKP